MGIKQKIAKKANRFIYWHLEFDRAGERKVKKSIAVWHKGGWFNCTRAKLMWNRIRKKYSCDIYPGITCGKGLRIEHPMWICIGKTAELGDNVRIYNGVQIIAKVTGDEQMLAGKERRHAKVGSNVILGSGATLIGPVTVGDNCIIGARAIVTHDIPANSVVIGTNQVRERRDGEAAPKFKTSTDA